MNKAFCIFEHTNLCAPDVDVVPANAIDNNLFVTIVSRSTEELGTASYLFRLSS